MMDATWQANLMLVLHGLILLLTVVGLGILLRVLYIVNKFYEETKELLHAAQK